MSRRKKREMNATKGEKNENEKSTSFHIRPLCCTFNGNDSIPVWAVIFTFSANPYSHNFKSFLAFSTIQLRNQNEMSAVYQHRQVPCVKILCACVRALWQRTNTHHVYKTQRRSTMNIYGIVCHCVARSIVSFWFIFFFVRFVVILYEPFDVNIVYVQVAVTQLQIE